MPWLGGCARVSQVTQTTGQEGSMRGRRSGSRVVICEGRVICTPPPRPLESGKRGVASPCIPRALYRWREKGIDVQYVRNRSGSNASGGREMAGDAAGPVARSCECNQSDVEQEHGAGAWGGRVLLLQVCYGGLAQDEGLLL